MSYTNLPLTVNIGRTRSGQVAAIPVSHTHQPTQYFHPQVVHSLRNALADIAKAALGTTVAAIAERALRDTAL